MFKQDVSSGIIVAARLVACPLVQQVANNDDSSNADEQPHQFESHAFKRGLPIDVAAVAEDLHLSTVPDCATDQVLHQRYLEVVVVQCGGAARCSAGSEVQRFIVSV